MKLKLKRLIILLLSFISISPCFSQTALTRDSVIRFASKYLETPYRIGGSTPKAFDCSGFTSFVFNKFGYNLYRTSGDQLKNANKIVEKHDLQPGDLVFFKGRNAKQNRIGHVGIVYEVDENGNFKFIHASCKYGVTITSFDKDYYTTRFVTAGRVLEDRSFFRLEPLPAGPIEIRTPQPNIPEFSL